MVGRLVDVEGERLVVGVRVSDREAAIKPLCQQELRAGVRGGRTLRREPDPARGARYRCGRVRRLARSRPPPARAARHIRRQSTEQAGSRGSRQVPAGARRWRPWCRAARMRTRLGAGVDSAHRCWIKELVATLQASGRQAASRSSAASASSAARVSDPCGRKPVPGTTAASSSQSSLARNARASSAPGALPLTQTSPKFAPWPRASLPRAQAARPGSRAAAPRRRASCRAHPRRPRPRCIRMRPSRQAVREISVPSQACAGIAAVNQSLPAGRGRLTGRDRKKTALPHAAADRMRAPTGP